MCILNSSGINSVDMRGIAPLVVASNIFILIGRGPNSKFSGIKNFSPAEVVIFCEDVSFKFFVIVLKY